jgi:type II secretory pathway component GspD/PulD (secretin)
MKHLLIRHPFYLGLLLAFWLANLCQAQMSTRTGTSSRSTSTRSSSNRSGSGSSSTRSYNSNGTMGDATIASDQETKSVVVITDEETGQAISQIVTNLDRPKPQVLIKVVFLEVTHTDDSDLGVEGSYTHKISNTTTGILSTAFGLASESNGGFYSILGKDFQVALHTMMTAGKTEVLSRPSVLARHNQMATIVVGQQVPLITGTTYDNYGKQINSIKYTDIGIILKVTPFITKDEMVEMIINPTISSLTDQTVEIATGVNVPIIANRSADTVVITPDGMPVVIGGLLQNQVIDSTKKVPLLGDIPLLGWAFKRNTKSDVKTELIMILIPHIMRTPEQLAAMSSHEANQLKVAPKAFSQEELDRFIDSLPVKKDSLIKSTQKTKKKKAGNTTENRSKM